jgi:hypothetical protein
MNQFLKSILALGITSALGISVVNAETYKVIDKADVSSLKYTYSQQENNKGEAAISGTNIYNFPVQYQYFTEKDYDEIVKLAKDSYERVFSLNDIENESALRAGTPVANDLSWVVRYLASKSSNRRYQKVGNIFAMIDLNNGTQLLNVFDEKFEGTEAYTRSTTDYISGITNEGWIYGNASAPFLPYPYTVVTASSDDEVGDIIHNWRREFATQGFFSPDGGVNFIKIVPPSEVNLPVEQRFGGISAILDINESHIAVGFGSTSIDKKAIDFIFDTSGETDEDKKPNSCETQKYLNAQKFTFEDCVQVNVIGSYNTEAIKWTIDAQGIVTSEILGQLVTPHVDDDREFVNYAQAVNNHGVAVGYAHGWIDETETNPSVREGRNLYAVVYKNGQVTDFTDDHGKYFDSRAYDINDKGIAVGHANVFVNGNQRTKFYHVDTNAEKMEMILPTDFFAGSSSTARAINENGLIVGEGEFETHNDDTNNPRRTHGFLYDTTAKTFTDLNSFLTCDSAYTIIEARDINDANEVAATAIVKVPRRDSKGELMLDEKGEQLTEDVVRAVTLKPVDGEIEDCSVVEEKIERQGAGFGIAGLMLLMVAGLRRRFVS